MIVPINLYAGPATTGKSACSGAEPSWTGGLIHQLASNHRVRDRTAQCFGRYDTPQRSKQQCMAGVHFFLPVRIDTSSLTFSLRSPAFPRLGRAERTYQRGRR